MKIDLLPPGSWEIYCQQLEAWFPMPKGGIGLRAYNGVAHGLHEALVSLAQLYPHKRSVVVIEGTTPHFAPQLKFFSKEGYQITRLLPEALETTDWGQALPKDCLLVLAAQDHAVTGELFDLSKLEEAAGEQRIFCVRYSHSLWRTETLPELGKYTLQLCSVSPELSVLFHGGRFKAPPILSQLMFWPPPSVELCQMIQTKSAIIPEKIKSFESELPAGLKPYFAENRPRIFDRSVIVAEEMSADALIEELAENLGVELQRPPAMNLLDAPNQCRWGEISWAEWWLHQPPTEEIYRGMVVIDQSLLERDGFKAQLGESYQNLRKLQNFSTTK